MNLFTTETMTEGVPMLLMAIIFPADVAAFYCPAVNCNRDQMQAVWPVSALPEASNMAPFLPAYADALQEGGCVIIYPSRRTSGSQ